MSKLSLWYDKALKSAENVIEDQGFMSKLLDLAFDKLGLFTNRLYKIHDQLLSLLRMLNAYVRRDYKDVSLKAILAMLAATIYFVNPVDMISDFLPLIGFADDITVISYVVTAFNAEIEKFKVWEQTQAAE